VRNALIHIVIFLMALVVLSALAIWFNLGPVVHSAEASAPPEKRSVWDGVYTYAQADRGHALYDRYCLACHGRYLEGIAQLPSEPVWLRKPPLSGGEFRANWNQMSLGDLLERQRISMPQNAPGTLNRQQNADLVAYVLQQNGYPSGVEEIPPERLWLDSIEIASW
jgi:mono/diheme cytochrome c family protein